MCKLNKVKKAELKAEQLQIMQDMQKAGFNVVTCGNCGQVLLHRTGADELQCDNCLLQEDTSVFPDLIY